jgi:beta-glucanase (GH16 family)
MKFNSSSIFLALVAFGFVAVNAQDNYQLVWSDEFNGNSLDGSKWGYEVNCDGGGNNELQCYTANAANLKVANGALTITTIPQAYNGKQYTSARINTKGKAAWKYGKFEIRAKMPNGAYLWPALWMMPRDSVYGGWAASGEIDIYEGRGQNVREYQSTLHYGSSWPNNVYQGSGARTANADLSADFHVYTCTWTADQISFALDGNTYYTRNLNTNFYGGKGTNPYTANRQPFDQPFFFIINQAVGGGFFGAQANALTSDMARAWSNPNLVVDYVRVYQIGSGPVIVNPVPVPTSQQVKTSTTQQQQPSVSVGESIGVTSAESSAVSTAATSAKWSAASSAKTTYTYATPRSTAGTSQVTPATTGSNDPSACPSGCGAGSCCKDAVLGGVCYNPNTYHCTADSAGALHLCAKGAGYCQRGGCYDASFYKCVNGGLALL